MARKKADTKLTYILIAIIIILSIAVIYLYSTKSTEVTVVASSEKAAEVQKDLGTSISDIKSDLEQLKKSLGK